MTVLIRAIAVLSVVLLLFPAASGQRSQDRSAVEALELTPSEHGIEFTVRSTGRVRYSYFKLDGPRLVVDFHGADNRLDFTEKEIGSAGVARVRASFFSDTTREATRIVFDLNQDVPIEVTDPGDGEVKIRFFQGTPTENVARVADPGAVEQTDRFQEETDSDGGALGTASRVDAPIAGVDAEPAVFEELSVAQIAEDFPFEVSHSPSAQTLLASLQPEFELEASTPAQLRQVYSASVPAAVPASVGTVATPAVVASLTSAAAPTAFARQDVQSEQSPQYSGELVTFDFRDLPLQDFFRLIGDISGLNVILDPAVSGSVTLLLRDVPWDQALDVVLRNNNLGYQLEGNVLRIATQATLQAEEDASRQLREAQELNAPLETRTFILSYTQADTVSMTIQDLLSPRGTIITDARRNALIVSDIPNQFGRIDSLIAFLDTPAQQVEIEARLLSATKSFSRDLGSQIGLLVGNNSQNVLTGIPNALSSFQRTPATAVGESLPLIADFPSAGATSGLSYLLGAGGDVLLDAIITAAEAKGTAKLLSRPRVTTQNNQPATVSQGTQIPVQTNVNNTITVTFVDFSLNLTVTPQITEEGTILLTATIENSSPDFGRTVGTSQIPSVSTQQAQTQVLIPDGGTAVVGGILLDTDSVNVSQVPGLGNIPLLGNLFKSTQVVRSTSELLFFITARIKPANPLEFLTEAGTEASQGVQ